MSEPSRSPNRLAGESSPYLLQHQFNPVDWYPWGDEAFAKAAAEDKPIFLSVGYATCHWCHVMENQSFEDSEAAAIINRVTVPVKLDREERPDIDHVYMSVLQSLTGSGGWPMTILLLPDKRPFFAATYLHKSHLIALLTQVEEYWRTNRAALVADADSITSGLQEYMREGFPGEPPKDLLLKAAGALMERYDPVHGGFGNRPKFPSPANLVLLLRAAFRTGEGRYRDAALHQLRSMRAGGIYDALGYGIHRYSTDAEWRLPHFEKMLYDQAMAVWAYTEAYRATGDESMRKTAEEILIFVERELTSPEGAFYAAIDADSEGVEGKFYVWSEEELSELLSPEEFRLARGVFGTRPEGNFADEATGKMTGENVLLSPPNLSPEFAERLEMVRSKLFAARSQRVRPITDDKILTDWNGLMIAAAAMAGRYFSDVRWTVLARRAADDILSRLKHDGTIPHSRRGDVIGPGAMLADVAALSFGLSYLYEATAEPEYLATAAAMIGVSADLFWDSERGGYYMARDFAEDLIAQPKEATDGAIPSGNSLAAMALARIGALTANSERLNRAQEVLVAFGAAISAEPLYAVGLALAQDQLQHSAELVLSGEEFEPLRKAADEVYRPTMVTIYRDAAARYDLEQISSFVGELPWNEGETRAYFCREFSCLAPISDPDALRGYLAE